jgi:hypothetical protein
MATWRYVSLNLEEARLLADLAGVEQDLVVAESFCDLLFEERRESPGRGKVPPNPELWEALTVAASVRYARAFASSVRTKICKTMVETVVKDLPAELASDHQRYIVFRNKYIAHSVNQFEENRVVAYLVPEERGPRGVASISVQHERLVSLGMGDAKRLKALCVEMRSVYRLLSRRRRPGSWRLHGSCRSMNCTLK